MELKSSGGNQEPQAKLEARNSKLEAASELEAVSRSPFRIVVVGASTGGLQALEVLLSGLGAEFPLPVVVVQHRLKDPEIGLCEFLSKHSSLPIREPEDKELLVAGHAYLAPADYHLLIEDESFALSTDQPVAFARPSIDVLFESAADVFKAGAIGMILTGANHDGVNGLAAIKAQRGMTLVEDPRTAVASELPRAAIAGTKVDFILPLQAMAPCLRTLIDLTAARGLPARAPRQGAMPYGN